MKSSLLVALNGGADMQVRCRVWRGTADVSGDHICEAVAAADAGTEWRQVMSEQRLKGELALGQARHTHGTAIVVDAASMLFQGQGA
ncbi:hypothetical protein TSA66_02445 [Noviherbaspirillum autotrophicum]|uniref:Uncharacterized protein n=1 Tax=Noviherbaspirillum autotrophicum TaxID=709839 RepID=A0A0C2BPJ2_9BURK|nr:hypothetical protein TSA66_02445 [Noviherbaspirillum autotrophicum]